ncbi:MAG: hypothetical protein RTV72_17480 [Candidatus Thorarchaeota archaeon]
MRRRHFGVQKTSIIVLLILNLIILNTLVSPASGYISAGKIVDFHYYHCSGDWGYPVRFTVVEWDSFLGIAVIRETNISAVQEYRLRIPEWSIIDDNGDIIGMWNYCPIWIDTSSMVEGMIFQEPDNRLCNYSVDYLSSTRCVINRTIRGEEYDRIEHLYYDGESGLIEQWDSSKKYPDNTVYTVRLLYLEEGWPSTTTSSQTQPTGPSLTPFLVAGIAIELLVIIYFLTRRLRN